MRFRNGLTALYFLTSIYAFGGGVMQGLMNYPAWKLIGAAEFPAFHQSIDRRIFVFFVPVFFLSVPISILMIWFGHPALARALRAAAAGLTLVIFVATMTLAIPIQDKLAVTKSVALIDQLITYDFALRIIPGFVIMVLNFLMLQQLMGRASVDQSLGQANGGV